MYDHLYEQSPQEEPEVASIPIPIRPRSKISIVFEGIGKVLLAPMLFVTLVGFTAPWFSTADMLTHFSLHWLAITFVATILLHFSSQKEWFASAVLVLGYYIYVCYPTVVPEMGRKTPPGKVVNVYQYAPGEDNNAIAYIVRQILEVKPDVVALENVSPEWQGTLEYLYNDYPYHVGDEDNYESGMAVFSRWPISASATTAVVTGKSYIQRVAINPEEDKKPFIFYHASPPAPSSGSNWEIRNATHAKLANMLYKELYGHVIVVSSFGATPYSPHYREFVKKSGLRSAAQGMGVLPTWSPIRVFSTVTGLPLDQLFASKKIFIMNRQTLPAIRSDHAPVLTQTVLTKY